MRNIICKVVSSLSAMMLLTSMNISLANAEKISDEKSPNTADSSWTGGSTTCFGEFNNGVHCYHRRKYNSTSIYVKNSSSKNAKISVFGEYSMYYPMRYDVSYYYNDYTQKITKGTTDITIPANSERLVQQFIHENGFKYAHVHFTTSGTNGVWSPDSVGSYYLAN